MARVKVRKFAQDMELEILYDGGLEQLELRTANVNRPGLHLAGFDDYFASDRIQLLGKVEMTYLMEALDPAQRYRALEVVLSHPIPCVVVSRSLPVPDELYKLAQKYHCPIFRSSLVTTQLMIKAINYLEQLLAVRISRHGVLVDVNGVGILITGESGIGKSETALELVKRGHRLVADDVVEISRIYRDQLVGTAPESVRHFMEIRGIGIIDIRQMYGIGSVLIEKTIDLVIEMELWKNEKVYDRVGEEDQYTTILGVRKPRIVVPVRPGRNLGIIIEVAANNYQLKALGYNAAKELEKRFFQPISKEE